MVIQQYTEVSVVGQVCLTRTVVYALMSFIAGYGANPNQTGLDQVHEN